MEYLKKLYGKTVINSSDSEELNEEPDIELEYYETKNGLVVLEDTKPYGIEIIKKQTKNKQENIEAKVMNNICEKEYQASEILDFLMNYKVTPISVEDVLADQLWLATAK